MSYLDFPSLTTSPAISKYVTFRYPDDNWDHPAVITQFEDQISVEVQLTSSTGFYGLLNVVIQAQETDADIIDAFLKGQGLIAVPFYFTHRKRGRILVRYWPGTNPPRLPYRRLVSGLPDLVGFDLPLRQEGGA